MTLLKRAWSACSTTPFHPALVAVYPIAAMTAANLGQMQLSDAARSLALAVLAAASVLIVCRVLLGDWPRAAMMTSLLLLLFFSYGHIYRALKTVHLGSLLVGRHRFLLPVWALLAVAGGWAIGRSRRSWSQATVVLNLVSAIALAMPSVAILIDGVRQASLRGGAEAVLPASQAGAAALAPEDLPDVYYIITDAYGRSDILQEQFGYDNSAFIAHLKDQGFFVADESQANYLWTHLSLASSLNLDYLQTLVPDLDEEGARLDVNRFIKHSLVRRRLEELGYATVGFATGWDGSELFDADYIMTPGMSRAELLSQRQGFNDFEGMLVESTLLRALTDLDLQTSTPVTAFIAERMKSRFTVQREIILGLFENLQRVPSTPGPKFVFVHVISPHGPYIFGPNGEPIEPHGAFTLAESEDAEEETSRRLYRDQAQYIARRLQESIDVILAESDRPVVILLQSDHGPSAGLDVENPDAEGLQSKSRILNAYYVPEACRSQLYPSITPVNSFRVVFRCLYGDPYTRLEDVTWWGYHRYTDLEQVLQTLEAEGGGAP